MIVDRFIVGKFRKYLKGNDSLFHNYRLKTYLPSFTSIPGSYFKNIFYCIIFGISLLRIYSLIEYRAACCAGSMLEEVAGGFAIPIRRTSCTVFKKRINFQDDQSNRKNLVKNQ